jgi:hypothetical protein
LSSIIISTLFLISFLLVLGLMFLIKTSDSKRNIILDFPIKIILYFCLLSFIVGIVNLTRIPINLLSVSIINFVISVACFLYIKKTRQWQKYYASKFDLLAFLFMLAVVIIIAVMRFGWGLNINYETSDPGVHFKDAMDIYNSQQLSGMYFYSFICSIVISFFAPFTILINYYKIYILIDILMYILSALLFYSVIRYSNISKHGFKYKILCLIVSIIYMLGYPLNNLIFGFGYLGVGTSVIMLIFYLANQFNYEKDKVSINILSLVVSCYSIIICYSLFSPFIFIILFLFLCIIYAKKKELFSINFILLNLKIFLIPTILGFIYSYFGTFNETITITSQIATEGYIFRDLFSSFIIFLPFCIYQIIIGIKSKSSDIISISFIVFALLILVSLVLGLNGYMSSYYFFKLYYPMWFFCLYLFYLAVVSLFEKSKEFIISYFTVWIVLAAFGFSGTEQSFNRKNVLFSPQLKSLSYMEVFKFNNDMMSKKSNNSQRMELYHEMYKIQNKPNNDIYLVDTWLDTYWFEAISNQRFDDYYYWVNGDKAIEYIQHNCKYVIISNMNKGNGFDENSTKFYNEHKDYFETLHIVYKNDLGYIAKIENRD